MSVARKFAVTRASEDLAWPRGGPDAFNRGLMDARAGEPLALGQPGNLYTFILVDSGNLISSAIEAQIAACANYVIALVSQHIGWQGILDFVVDIRPASQSPYPEVNGILPSVAQVTWNGSAWINRTLEECLTGVDSDSAAPDAGCTIYLASDGTIRNYGAPVWFDPNPQFGVDPDVPAGTHDFIGIYTHEIFHALGFYQVTQQWRDHIFTTNGISLFMGEATEALGGPLPFHINSDHYGITTNPAVGIDRGLMYALGNYEENRLDIGRIDLAVLEDLGHAIKTYDGLPLFEFLDNSPNLTGGTRNDRLYGDYHANRLTGLGGGDMLEGGGGADIFAYAGANDSEAWHRSDGKKQLPDIVSGFVPGEDRIDLSAIDAVAGTAGNDAFTFIGTAAFSGQSGQLRTDLSNGAAQILADLNGDGIADLHIVAMTATALVAADFIL